MAINSNSKGKRGEREACKKIMEVLGGEARRSQQYSGLGDSSADIIFDDRLHFEIKRVNRLNLQESYEQAERDSLVGQIPVVMHRRDRAPWMITLKVDDLIEFAKVIARYEK